MIFSNITVLLYNPRIARFVWAAAGAMATSFSYAAVFAHEHQSVMAPKTVALVVLVQPLRCRVGAGHCRQIYLALHIAGVEEQRALS